MTSASELGELRRLALKCYTVREIRERTGRSKCWVERNLKRMGLFHLVRTRTPWTDSDLEVLRARFPHEKTAGIARDLGREPGTVSQMAAKLGLRKSAKYLASPDACRLRRDGNPGIAYRYPKGHVPANKGTRRPGFSPGRMSATQFRRGERSVTAEAMHQPIGTEVVRAEGYRWRKVNDDLPVHKRWREVHRLLWEEHRGPIPPGHSVTFINGEKSDIRIENLELLTRRQLLDRNSIYTRYPPELVQVMKLAGALKRKVRNREHA